MGFLDSLRLLNGIFLGAWVKESHFIDANGLAGQPETHQKINSPTKIPIILKEDGRRTLGKGMKRKKLKSKPIWERDGKGIPKRRGLSLYKMGFLDSLRLLNGIFLGAWVKKNHFIDANGLTGQPETHQKINSPTKVPIFIIY